MDGTAPVGVIVPVRGPAPHLDEALRSVLSQRPRPDGCELVRREAPGGPAAARQAALAAIREEWVALCDADDAWEDGRLAAQLAAAEGADVVFGSAAVVDGAGSFTSERLPEAEAGSYEGDELVTLLWSRQPVVASSALVRRSVLLEAGGFAPAPAPLASDWDLWLRLAEANARFVAVPEARVRYRRHAGGVTADLIALAESSLAVRRAHRSLVSPALFAEGEAADLRALARGYVRARRWAEARTALREAGQRAPIPARDRLVGAVTWVPGLRAALGRRPPYR